jgi:hypothetical protein
MTFPNLKIPKVDDFIIIFAHFLINLNNKYFTYRTLFTRAWVYELILDN